MRWEGALTALAIVCYLQDGDPGLLEEIMRGGLSVMQDAGCVVLGGHSMRDAEMKFGYAVTGLIDPNRVFTNCAARTGDSLVLGKAIGTGVITTALKQGRNERSWIDAAIASMTRSNRRAAEIATRGKFAVHAITDVTGFGLMGHAREMAMGSNARLAIEVRKVPLLKGALEAAGQGCVPAGLLANREFAECFAEEGAGAEVPDGLRMLLYDPQTSGGLLIALPPAHADLLVSELCDAGYAAAVIGEVMDGTPKIVRH